MSVEKYLCPEGANELKTYALSLPEAVEEHPWGHDAIKVCKKTFVFLSGDQLTDGSFSMSIKLPESAEIVLMMPFTTPTGYGLGKSNWVSAGFKQGELLPVAMLKAWITESYLAIAPKKLSAQLDNA